MANILLIEQSRSFIISALGVHLESLGHSLTIARNDSNAVREHDRPIDIILICVEDAIMGELVYIKERVIAENIPVFVIGDADAMKEVTPIIPAQFVKKHFLKPINIKAVADFIGAYQQTDLTQTKKKILVVDDSGPMLRNIKNWLEDKYQVFLANSGASAIKSLAMNQPDLVLLDYEMPVCDGKQVLEMIRSESEFANIPVIFLTSKSDKESVVSVTSLKPEGYLLKTMEPRCIIQSIDNFFKRDKLKSYIKQ